nr:hypothetical protein [Tanacetum cinerariifolium]
EEKRIEEEQAVKARYWKIPACCDDDDDYDSTITHILSTEEPVDSLNDISSSDDDSLHEENIEYVEASPHDSELVSLEAVEFVIPKVEEIEDDNLRKKLLNRLDGNTTTYSDISLSKYDSFIFDFAHEEFTDELAHIISPSEYDCFYFWNLPDPGTIFDPGITINHFYSFKPGSSHRHGDFKKFNIHRSHLNEWPMIINGKNTPILDVHLFHFYPP